jgi:hypothetical protein
MDNTISGGRKICFMWIAFYDDGTCLPEFDIDDSEGHELGREHHFKEIDQNKLIKFGLFPIPEAIAEKAGKEYYSDLTLPKFILNFQPDQRLIGGIIRESQTEYGYSKCLKCGFEWQWMPNNSMGLSDGEIGYAGLPIYGEKYSYQLDGRCEVICPNCGVRNELECSDCHHSWNKVETEDSRGLPEKDRKYRIECPLCKKERIQNILYLIGHFFKEVYLLGWQKTLPDGSNKKFIMYIYNDGTFELSDDYGKTNLKAGMK